MVTVKTLPCPRCGEVVDLEVSERSLTAFKNGMFVQDAFPSLSPENRERLLSGYCGPCWDILFPDDE